MDGVVVRAVQRSAAGRRSEKVRNLAWNYAGALVASIVGFATTPTLIRVLGVESFGMLAIFAAMNSYATLFDLGVGLAGMKLISEHSIVESRKKVASLASNIAACYSLSSLIIVLLLLVIYPVAPGIFNVPGNSTSDFQNAYIFASLSVSFAFAGSALSGILLGIGDFKSYNLAAIGIATIGLGSTVSVAYVSHSIVYTMAASATVVALGQVYKLYRCKRNGVDFSPALVNSSTLREIISFSVGMFGINVASRAILDSDAIVIGAASGPISVGLYQVAASPALAVRRMSDQLVSVTLTATSRSHAIGRRDQVRSTLIAGTRYSAITMVPPVAFACLYGREFLTAWVGPRFSSAEPALTLLLSAVAVIAVQSTSAQVLISQHLQKRLAVILSLEAIANVILSVVLLRHIGITGVALATLLPTLLTACLYTIPVAARSTQTPVLELLKPMIGPVGAAVAAGSVLLVSRRIFVHPSFIVVVVTGLTFAVAYVFILLAVDRRSRILLLRSVRPSEPIATR